MSGSPATDALTLLLPSGTEPVVLAVIWATVDIERVLAGIGLAGEELPDDRLLGATVRLVRPPAGEPIALLEPRTEGRIAATLAQLGRGTGRTLRRRHGRPRERRGLGPTLRASP